MIRKSPIEAYRWWNSTLNPFGEVDSPPRCISPIEAAIVWNKFFPIFRLIAQENVPMNQYWKSISGIISHFYASDEIPNPATNFPDFVILLHQLHTVIQPRSIVQCIQFLDMFKYQNFADFFLYEIPLYFFEPMLYFRSILEACDSGHPIWKQFVSNPHVCDAFFFLHSNFLQPLSAPDDSVKWLHHLLLGELLHRILSLTIRTNTTNTIKNSNKYADLLLRLIPCSPIFVKVTATRWLLSITKLTLKKNEKDVLKERVKQIISLLRVSPDIFLYTVQYIRDNLTTLIGPSKLINSISVNSLANIDLLLNFTKKIGPMIPITRLARGAISSKIWLRAAFQAMTEIILRFANEVDLKDWFTTFVRRMFIFVALANITGRYKTRALFVTESLSKLIFLRINWLRQLVLNISYTINATRSAPPYFSGFFPPNSSNDELTFNEFEAFQRVSSLINLKTFPFDGRKSTFILPPALDNQIGPLPPMPPQLPPVQRGHIPHVIKSNRRIQSKKSTKKKACPVIKKPQTPKHLQHFKQ